MIGQDVEATPEVSRALRLLVAETTPEPRQSRQAGPSRVELLVFTVVLLALCALAWALNT